MRWTVSFMALLAVCAAQAFGDDPALKALRAEFGYVDLSQIQVPKGAANVAEITLGPDLIKAAMGALVDSAGQGLPPGLLDGIKGIQVRAFEASGEQTKEIHAVTQRIAEDMQKKGWSRIVRVAEGDEVVSIDVAFHNGAMAGLMIMALEEKEVAIVNLVGSLNLAAILQLASRGLDPAVLDSLQKAVQQATGSK